MLFGELVLIGRVKQVDLQRTTIAPAVQLSEMSDGFEIGCDSWLSLEGVLMIQLYVPNTNFLYQNLRKICIYYIICCSN